MKYGGIKLTKKEIKKRRKKADEYFASLGINPDTKGNMHQERILDRKPIYKPEGDIVNAKAMIEIDCYLFYTHIEITMQVGDDTYVFYGNSGGVGLPGGMTQVGDVTYSDLETLLATTTFGVFFAGDEGGGVEVTWGSHGNCLGAGTADCFPCCAGSFGGSGNWVKKN